MKSIPAALRDVAKAFEALAQAYESQGHAKAVVARKEPQKSAAPEPAAPRQKPIPVSTVAGISNTAARVLSVLEDSGVALDRQQIAVRACVAYKSSSLDKALAELRAEQLIGTEAGRNGITAAGVKLGPFPELPQGAALFEWWVNQVGRHKAPGKVLLAMRTATRAGAPSQSRQDISDATGIAYSSSSLDKALAKLRGLELLHGGGPSNWLCAELQRAAEVTITVHDRQSGRSVRVDRSGKAVG